MSDRPQTTDLETCAQDDMVAEFDGTHVTIEETGGMAVLTQTEALALRHWLNRVLP